MSQINFEKNSFQLKLENELESFTIAQANRYSTTETLKIDLHCHDHNSDVPDELLGRILKVPETWLPTEKLIRSLQKNGSDVVTITNHNNARSCFKLQNEGFDVLVGAEFSCTVPDFNIGIHVLTYGFDEKQELVLNKLRKNLYQFLQYTCKNNIPTIWAHPLYHYSVTGLPSFDFFRKMAIVFERFEVLNGQRDTWQNMLVYNWLQSLTPTEIDETALEFNIDLSLYCKNRYRKSFSGGSDSHMGIFAGQTGTYLHIPNLIERIKTESASSLALEAIRNGKMAPYGNHHNSEKLTIAFLDYVFQIAMNKKDPGLLRILLHKGSSQDKVLALLISNAFSELKRHKVTMRFIELFHNCFIGIAPSKSKRIFVPKVYKPIFDQAKMIVKAHELNNSEMVQKFNQAITNINTELTKILFARIESKVKDLAKSDSLKNIKLVDIIENLEIPSEFRSIVNPNTKKWRRNKNMVNPNISDFFDGLPFPLLASSLIMAARFTSSKVLYNNRPLLKTFSDKIGKLQHPKRMLWLSDTFDDKNGVSSVLKEFHKVIKEQNLPIDILVCSNTVKPDDHLIVIKPIADFTLPFYKEQAVRVPNLQEVHDLFLKNEYDRILCSTEGVMGAIALYLKNAYSVPASFYMHSDWIMFARKVLKLDTPNLDRVRRMLRAYYGAFDQLFVLNTDHKKWLTGNEMAFNEDRVKLTAHWVNEQFTTRKTDKKSIWGINNYNKVLLFAGRLSKEKGIAHIVDIYSSLKEQIPNLKIVFAGTGPEEEQLKKDIPDAIFMGWVDSELLPDAYSAADLLILPSKFDTFSCVVLESLSCGTPVIAYKAKGPKDIIIHDKCGYLVNGKKDMAKSIIDYLNNEKKHLPFKNAALKRAQAYSVENILSKFLEDIDLNEFYTKKEDTQVKQTKIHV